MKNNIAKDLRNELLKKYTEEELHKYGMRDIEGYEGRYAITSCGRIWSYNSNKFLAPVPAKDGYLKVNLYDKNGKMRTFQIHRLVGQAYIPNLEDLPEINHKSEIKTQNWIENLEWCTHDYNMNYGTRSERQSQSMKIAVYSPELDMTFDSLTDAGKYINRGQDDISKCINGKIKHAGKHPVTGELLTWQMA